MIFWCFAAWLISMLIGAGVWRHLINRGPLAYTASLWSIVFALGMFAVAAISLGRVDKLPIVEAVGDVALVGALLAWLMVLVAKLGGTGRLILAQ